jgi:pentatricopeptide repeat protein
MMGNVPVARRRVLRLWRGAVPESAPVSPTARSPGLAKRKKQQKPRQSSRDGTRTTPSSVSPGAPPTEADAGRAEYQRTKLLRFVRQDRTDDAWALLDAWLPRTPQTAGVRFRWLLEVWPEGAAVEVGRPDALGIPSLAAVAMERATVLPTPVVEALSAAPTELAAELVAVARASAAVAADDDEGARELLRPIGLRSPLREAKTFVLGLSAFYQHRDDDARRGLGAITESAVYGAVARELLARLGAGFDPAAHAGADPDVVAFAAIGALLGEKKGLAALREANERAPMLSDGARTALRRDLPGALLALGLTPSQVLSRAERGLGNDPSDPSGSAAAALATEGGIISIRDTIDHWRRYADEVGSGAGDFDATERTVALAQIHRKIAELFSRLAEDASAVLDEVRGADEAGDLDSAAYLESLSLLGQAARETALTHLQLALVHDDSDREIWSALLEGLLRGGREEDALDVAERMVERLEGDPAALALAAETARTLGAYQEALGYVRACAVLGPLDQAHRDLEAELRAEIVYEDLESEGPHPDLAEEVRAIAALTGLTPRARERALGVAWAYEASQGIEGAAHSFVELARAEGLSEWRLAAASALALHRIAEASADTAPRAPKKGRGKAKAAPRAVEVPLPSHRPSDEELEAVFRLGEETFDDSESPMSRLADQAARLTYRDLTGKVLLRGAILALLNPEDRLRCAERAAERYPTEAAFYLLRYGIALERLEPPEYFRDAVADLDHIVIDDAPIAEADLAWWRQCRCENCLRSLAQYQRLHEVRDQCRERAALATGGPKRGRKPTAGAPRKAKKAKGLATTD